jgi:hypothetical protein
MKQPAPGQVIDDQTGENDPQPAADPEDGRDEADSDADLLPRKLVADDSEAQREDRRAEALEGAEEDQRPDVPGGHSARAADEEERERDDEEPLLAVLVAKFADDRRRDGGDQQKHGQHPRHPGRGRAQVALQRRQRGDHHRLLKGVGRARDRQDRERDVVVLPPCLGH